MVSTASNIMCMYWESVSDVARNITHIPICHSKHSFLDLHVVPSLRFQILAKTTISQKKKRYFCLLLVQLKSVVEC
jgi:hypothetical protein